MELRLSPARVREELFTGGFRPMVGHDFDGFADAEIGSLIADEIRVGRFVYTAIFTPSVGSVQVFAFTDNDSFAWEMDLVSDKIIKI